MQSRLRPHPDLRCKAPSGSESVSHCMTPPDVLIFKYTWPLISGVFNLDKLLIEKVHLDDLDLYVITFIALATSVLL